ncbi:MAG: transposase [Endozoicomonas sp.]
MFTLARIRTGRLAYDPAMLLKVVLFAYSRGITSSRKIEKSCRENHPSGICRKWGSQSPPCEGVPR